jgi:hypothetical protein
LLKGIPSGDLTDEQRHLLAEGQADAETLAASDARLQRLVAAAKLWQQHGAAEGQTVLDALQAITPFDRARFTDVHEQVMTALSEVDIVMHGRELGLTAATKGRLPLFIFSTQNTPLDHAVVAAVISRLTARQSHIVPDRVNAALVTDINIESLGEPQPDDSGPIQTWRATARLEVDVTWASDNAALFAGPVEVTGRINDPDGRSEVQKQALCVGVAAIVDRFERLTGGDVADSSGAACGMASSP